MKRITVQHVTSQIMIFYHSYTNSKRDFKIPQLLPSMESTTRLFNLTLQCPLKTDIQAFKIVYYTTYMVIFML